MKANITLGIALPVLALMGCNPSDPQSKDVAEPTAIAMAQILSADGQVRGTATLVGTAQGPVIEVALNDMEPGEKAFHLHTTGTCEGPDFASAGGHLNPFDRKHGSLSEGGKHLGDLPNLMISDTGSVSESFFLEGDVTELLPLLFDEDGTAVMVHAGPDDYASDPAGAAGPRIACGVLMRST